MKGVLTTESLTKDRTAKLNEAREIYSFRKVWTIDEKIFFIDEKNLLSKPLLYYD